MLWHTVGLGRCCARWPHRSRLQWKAKLAQTAYSITQPSYSHSTIASKVLHCRAADLQGSHTAPDVGCRCPLRCSPEDRLCGCSCQAPALAAQWVCRCHHPTGLLCKVRLTGSTDIQ